MIFKNHYQLDSCTQLYFSVTLKGKQTRQQEKGQSRSISKYVSIASQL